MLISFWRKILAVWLFDFFLKTALDWPMLFGPKLDCTSEGGHILDAWGASSNRIAFLLFVDLFYQSTNVNFFVWFPILGLLMDFLSKTKRN